jgi:uncharacterized lipoprotein
MAVDKGFRVAALCAVLTLAGGCRALSTTSCNTPQGYAEAHEVAPLKVPAGLQGLDTRRAVKIPALNEPAAPRGPDDPCVEAPPRYSNADLKAPTRMIPAPAPSGGQSGGAPPPPR